MYKVKLNVASGHAVGTTQDKPILRPIAAAAPAPAAGMAPVGLGLSLNLSSSLKQLNDPVSDAPALPTSIPLNARNSNLQPGAFAHLDNERVAAVVASELEDNKAAAPASVAPTSQTETGAETKDEELDGTDTMEDLASSMVIKSTAKTGISASLATSTDVEEAGLPDGLSSAIKKVHASLPSHPRSTAKKQAKKLKSAANAAAAAAAAEPSAEDAGGAPFETVSGKKNKKKKGGKTAATAAPAAAIDAKVGAGGDAAGAGSGGANAARVAKKKRDKKRLKKKAAAAAATTAAPAAPAPTGSAAIAPAGAVSQSPSAAPAPAPAPTPASASNGQSESPASPPAAAAPMAVRAPSSEFVDESAPESPYVKSNDAFNSYRAKKLAPGNLNKLAERLAHLPKVASAVKKGSAAGKSRPRLDDAFSHAETGADGSDESKHNGESSSAAQPSASGTENESPGSARGHGSSRRHRGRRDKKTQELHIHASQTPAVDPAVAQQLLEKQQAAAAASLAKSAEARARLRTMLSHASARSGGAVLGAGVSGAPALPKAGRTLAAGGTSLASLSGLSSHGTSVKTAPALAVRGLQTSDAHQAYQFPASSFQEFLKLNNEFVIREVLRHLHLDTNADGVIAAVLDHTVAVDATQ